MVCEYFWAREEEAAFWIIDQCRRAKIFSVDLETESEERPDFQSDRILQVNLGWAPGKAGVIRWKWFTDRVIEELKDLFSNPVYYRILHNGKFDAKFGQRLTGVPVTVDFENRRSPELMSGIERDAVNSTSLRKIHRSGIFSRDPR